MPSKQTVGTRRGNGSKGPGYGGPAKGDGAGKPTHEPFDLNNKMGSLPVNERAQLRRMRGYDLEDRLYQAIVGPDVAVQVLHQVTAFFIERVEGKARQAVEISGPEGGPMQSISLQTSDPVEAAAIYQRLISGR